MMKIAIPFILVIWSLSFNALAVTFKSGESINLNKGKEDWIPLIRTELHDVDISGAAFDFVNESFINALKDHSVYEMPTYGWDVVGTDVGNNAGTTREMDCTRVMTNLQVEFESQYDQPLYNLSCSQMYRVGLFKGGLEDIQNTLNHWANQEKGYYDIKGNYDNVIYARQVSITHLATTYAIFYDLFENKEKINSFFKGWLLNNQSNRKPGEKLCPFSNPKRYRTGEHFVVDACGSNHWRAAISNIALGLRLNDRDLFISGVKHLEINLSMYDEKGIFVPYASRGWDAPGYAIDTDEHIGAVAFLLDMIGVNLYDIKVKSGNTVKELVEGNQRWLRDPRLAADYILGTKTCNGGVCDIFDDFSKAGSLAQWKFDKDFDERSILMRSFDYQLKYNSEQYPDPLSLIDFETYNYLDKAKVWGTNNGFPLIFATMSRSKSLDSYIDLVQNSEYGHTDDSDKNLTFAERQERLPESIKKIGITVNEIGQYVPKSIAGLQVKDFKLGRYHPSTSDQDESIYEFFSLSLKNEDSDFHNINAEILEREGVRVIKLYLAPLLRDDAALNQEYELLNKACSWNNSYEKKSITLPIITKWDKQQDYFECVAENLEDGQLKQFIILAIYAGTYIELDKLDVAHVDYSVLRTLPNLGLTLSPETKVNVINGDDIDLGVYKLEETVKANSAKKSNKYRLRFQRATIFDDVSDKNIVILSFKKVTIFEREKSRGKSRMVGMDLESTFERYPETKVDWQKMWDICPFEDTDFTWMEVPIKYNDWLEPQLICLDENLENNRLRLMIRSLVKIGNEVEIDQL